MLKCPAKEEQNRMHAFESDALWFRMRFHFSMTTSNVQDINLHSVECTLGLGLIDAFECIETHLRASKMPSQLFSHIDCSVRSPFTLSVAINIRFIEDETEEQEDEKETKRILNAITNQLDVIYNYYVERWRRHATIDATEEHDFSISSHFFDICISIKKWSEHKNDEKKNKLKVKEVDKNGIPIDRAASFSIQFLRGQEKIDEICKQIKCYLCRLNFQIV